MDTQSMSDCCVSCPSSRQQTLHHRLLEQSLHHALWPCPASPLLPLGACRALHCLFVLLELSMTLREAHSSCWACSLSAAAKSLGTEPMPMTTTITTVRGCKSHSANAWCAMNNRSF